MATPEPNRPNETACVPPLLGTETAEQAQVSSEPVPDQTHRRADPGRGNAPITITIPRFWSRPRDRKDSPVATTDSRRRRRIGLPTKPSHRIGIAVAALVATAGAALAGDGHLPGTNPGGQHSTDQAAVNAAAGAGLSANPAGSVQPLTLAAADPLNPSAGAAAPTVSIPGVGQPATAAAPTTAPTVAPVVMPAAAPVEPLPAAPTVGQSAAPKALSSSGIPARAKTAYVNAANRMATAAPACKLPWTLVAAIGRVESNHARANGSNLIASSGRANPAIYGIRLNGTTRGTSVVRDTDHGSLDADPTYDRAVGPMQFLPATWRTFAADADNDGAANPQDIDDAALAAGRYLCTGATTNNLATQTGQWNAAYRYNHSTSYANLVLALATTYATGKPATVVNPPSGATTTLPTVTITITPTTTTATTTTPVTSTTSATTSSATSTTATTTAPATVTVTITNNPTTTTSSTTPSTTGSTVTITVTAPASTTTR